MRSDSISYDENKFRKRKEEYLMVARNKSVNELV